MGRQLVVMEFDRSGLHAVEVAVSRAGVRVLGSASAVRPAGVSADDPAATGEWIGSVLDAAGLTAKRVIVALPRDEAAVKRPQLPAGDADELPSMVAMAVQRDLPFDDSEAIIDFVRLPSPPPTTRGGTDATGPGGGNASGSRSTEASIRVLAAAISQRRLESARATLAAARRSLHGLTLRSLGSANLLARLSELEPVGDEQEPRRGGRELVLDIGDRGLELLVLEDGGVQFARAASLPAASADPAQRVRAILTEARRTWMSYRVAEDGDVLRAAVLGPAAIADPVIAELGDLLGVPVRRLDPRAAADADPDVAGRVLEDGGWPLVGLVLPAAEGRLDWTDPRRTPDRRRIAIRRAGLVAALLVIVAGGVWSFARQQLGDLRAELDDLREKRAEVSGDYARLQRDLARRIHLERWSSVDPSWLEHLAFIEASMPPPGEVVLDGLSGSLAYRGVDYDRREREWSSPFELTLVVEGEAATRTAAEALRGAFVDAEVYRVSSTGGDGRAGRRLPVGFTYRLGTRAAAPPPEVSPVAGGETDAPPVVARAEDDARSSSSSSASVPAAAAPTPTAEAGEEASE